MPGHENEEESEKRSAGRDVERGEERGVEGEEEWEGGREGEERQRWSQEGAGCVSEQSAPPRHSATLPPPDHR